MSQVKANTITIKLPDGSSRSLDDGATGADLAKSIAQGDTTVSIVIHDAGLSVTFRKLNGPS